MRIERRYTTKGQSPYAAIPFRLATSEIRNPDGSIVFRQDGIEVPESWSQVATDVLAQKYFRKAGVPARLKKVEENGVPSFLWRSVADEKALAELPEGERSVSETSAKQVFDRLAGCWTYWGWKGGYFSTEEDASAFYDELRYMLARQMCAPNSPQWFNTGLHWAYGIDGPAQGHYYVDHGTGELTQSASAYEHPQPHACFIQGVQRRPRQRGRHHGPVGARGAPVQVRLRHRLELLRRCAARASGCPAAGARPGLMSFLKIGDRAAGAIKSGGTTRRAAKMVVVDVDHPDIETYIDWKVREEQKVAALVTGSKICQKHLKGVMKACVNCEAEGDACFDPEKNPALKREIKLARRAQVPDNYIKRVIQFARQGYKEIELRHLRHRLGFGGLPHRLGPELEQLGLAHRRLPARRRGGRRLEPDRPHHRQGGEDAQGPRAVGEDRPRRLGLGRSRAALQHHHERLAHLPGGRADPGLEPVLGVHVPRRHGLQPRLGEPARPLRQGRQALRRRGLRAPRAAVDRGPRDLGPDGAVPVEGDRAALLRVPHARPRLRQHRRPAHDDGPALRLGRGPGALRRAHRHHDRRRPTRPRPRWRASSAPSRATPRTPTSMLRVIRNHRRAAHGEVFGYEFLQHEPGAARPRLLPRPAPRRRTPRRPGTRRSSSARATASATPRRR